MNILFLCSQYPNYLPDLTLHGLRKVFGDFVVDYPRKDIIYQGICGQPNLDPVPGLMADDSKVDRSDIAAKVAKGYFDFVIVDTRAFNDQIAILQSNVCPLAVLDGEDFPVSIKPGPYVILRHVTDGNDFSIPLPIGLPTEIMDWIDRYADQPKKYSVGFMGSRSPHTPDRNVMVDELARLFPDALLNVWPVGTDPGYTRDYFYSNLQSCKIVLNFPGAGKHAFRYWENAACNALQLAKHVPVLIPNDFREGHEILRFSGIRELAYLIERVLSDDIDWRPYAERSRAWLRQHHTTERRAVQLIDRLKHAFGI